MGIVGIKGGKGKKEITKINFTKLKEDGRFKTDKP